MCVPFFSVLHLEWGWGVLGVLKVPRDELRDPVIGVHASPTRFPALILLVRELVRGRQVGQRFAGREQRQQVGGQKLRHHSLTPSLHSTPGNEFFYQIFNVPTKQNSDSAENG